MQDLAQTSLIEVEPLLEKTLPMVVGISTVKDSF